MEATYFKLIFLFWLVQPNGDVPFEVQEDTIHKSWHSCYERGISELESVQPEQYEMATFFCKPIEVEHEE